MTKPPANQVPRNYTMDPSTEKMVRASELKNGMVVLISDNTSRANLDHYKADIVNRWCEVSDVLHEERKSYQTEGTTSFIGIYSNGEEFPRESPSSFFWYVKKDSTEAATELEFAAVEDDVQHFRTTRSSRKEQLKDVPVYLAFGRESPLAQYLDQNFDQDTASHLLNEIREKIQLAKHNSESVDEGGEDVNRQCNEVVKDTPEETTHCVLDLGHGGGICIDSQGRRRMQKIEPFDSTRMDVLKHNSDVQFDGDPDDPILRHALRPNRIRLWALKRDYLRTERNLMSIIRSGELPDEEVYSTMNRLYTAVQEEYDRLLTEDIEVDADPEAFEEWRRDLRRETLSRKNPYTMTREEYLEKYAPISYSQVTPDTDLSELPYEAQLLFQIEILISQGKTEDEISKNMGYSSVSEFHKALYDLYSKRVKAKSETLPPEPKEETLLDAQDRELGEAMDWTDWEVAGPRVFLSAVDSLKKDGLTESEIAKRYGRSVSQFRADLHEAKQNIRSPEAKILYAVESLRAEGKSDEDIATITGYPSLSSFHKALDDLYLESLNSRENLEPETKEEDAEEGTSEETPNPTLTFGKLLNEFFGYGGVMDKLFGQPNKEE